MPNPGNEQPAQSRLLRTIAEGTAAATGDEFFRSLARHAALALQARYAFIARNLSEMESQSLAYWEGSDFGQGFTYRFPGTPCQKVAAGQVCCLATGLRERYPEDRWLVDIGADSYVGVPLKNAEGRTLGHLAVLHTSPMEASPEDIAVLQIFAARACAELERKQADERLNHALGNLHRLNDDRERLLHIVAGSAVTERDPFARLVIEVAEAMGTAYAMLAESMEGLRSRTLALKQPGGMGPTSEWSLEGTPCEKLPPGRLGHFPSEVSRMFPLDEVIRGRGIESYLGMKLTTPDGRPIGHLCVFDTKPMPPDSWQFDIFRLFAARAAAELSRMRAERALTQSEERFRDLFEEAPIAYVHEGLDTHFIRANRTAIRLLGIKPEDVPTTYGKSFVPDTPEAQRRVREALESIGRGTDASGVVLELRRKDNGKPLWIQWWSRPDPSGTYTRTMFLDITDRVLMEQNNARLEAQKTYLQEEIRAEHNFSEIVGNSPALLKVLDQVEQVAPTGATVLILGETGTGKELIARAIHDRSPRRGHPLVKVNCGAISAGLVESELFGHVKGAFTGAIAGRDGRFKVADGGTIFLDEVGDLPLETQVKLLRVLQEQEFEPIGSSRTLKVDVRVIAATNRDLEDLVREGKFRRDLFYRLNVFPITLPALRERVADIPLLAMYFVQKFAKPLGRRISQVGESALHALCTYDWPGNIRELQNVIERAVVLSRGPLLELPGDRLAARDHASRSAVTVPVVRAGDSKPPEPNTTPVQALPPAVSPSDKTPVGNDKTLEDVERHHILQVLHSTQWRIEGPGGAAEKLNLRPSSLRSRMKKLNIRRPGSLTQP